MIDFVEEHRDEYGGEPICEVLPIAPSAYYQHRAHRLDPQVRPHRAKRDQPHLVDSQVAVVAERLAMRWGTIVADAPSKPGVWRPARPEPAGAAAPGRLSASGASAPGRKWPPKKFCNEARNNAPAVPSS